jgi:pimeloyl-ACP methyl ester carboxylesterase
MRKLLGAVVSDKSKITDALIDRRQKSATRPGAVEAMKDFVKNTGAARKNPALALQFDLRASLPAVAKQIPTIFVWGEADTFALPETGRAIEKAVPDIKFYWVPGAGHQVQTDKPKESAEIIRNFACS